MPRAIEISDTAAAWLVRLEGQTSPEIWEEFEAWMDQDPRHRAAFIRLRVAWNRVDRLKNMRPADGAVDADLLARGRVSPAAIMARGPQPVQRKQRKRLEDLVLPDRRRVLATAAAIAATGVFAWFGAYHFGWTPYQTSVGARAKIQLSDGSYVDLNTNTELNARISDSRREVMLVRGEALFHVAHDPKRPFYVVAEGTVVRAVGTEFSVRIRDPEHVEVLVAEGRVAVGAPGADANFENASLLAKAPKVSAGEAATVRRNSVAVHPVAQQNINRKLAWTAGRLDFQGETLEDAVQEFNRYNQRQITIADPSIVNVRVGGIFWTWDLESFTAALPHLGIRVQVGDNNGDIHLSAGGKPP
jgi:transmembrane sensor